MTICTPQTSRRELAKNWRRDAIAQSACRLLRHVPYADMSVAMIAKGAKVSVATVFNLFGSKSAILEAVVERDAEAVNQSISDRRGADSLDLMFDAVRLMAERYRANPAVYRNALGAQVRVSAEVQPAIWLRLARAAMLDGGLAPGADSGLIAGTLAYIQAGAMLHWLAGASSIERFEDDVVHAMAVFLAPYATLKGRRRIAERLAGEARDPVGSARAAPMATAPRAAFENTLA